uniref:C-type lectin domain-containing protein n=1 Tax=Anopheles atroparvus TaxID=41427 RepID=A0AAG5D1E6_ANOAO
MRIVLKVPFIVWFCVQIFLGTCISARDANSLKSNNTFATRKSYIVINEHARSFLEAWRFCMAQGMKLATISSANDSQLITAAINRSNNPKGPWWIGGTDLGMEGSFVWIATNTLVGRPFGYFDFSPGQPDNAGGNEHCLEIGRWGGVAWNDAACDRPQRFICEFQA